jgi:putative DNA primase/helicase
MAENEEPPEEYGKSILSYEEKKASIERNRKRLAEQIRAKNHEPALLVLSADKEPPRPIEWVWDGWLAAGKVHIMAGAPGTGKTTLSLALASAVSIGGMWPDRSRANQNNVLMWTGEDDINDTIIPRLIAMGADLSRVHFIKGTEVSDGDHIATRSFEPAKDLPLVIDAIRAIGKIGLLILDPIVSAVSGDSHKNTEVRRSLQPICDIGIHTRCAILGITHLTKNTSGREPLDRVTGSLAFGAVARVVMIASKLASEGNQGEDRRVLVRAKSNLGGDTGGFEYHLSHDYLTEYPDILAQSISWGNSVNGTAKEILKEPDDEDEGFGLSAVALWLSELLTEEGEPINAKEIVRLGKAQGFSDRTIYRAKLKLNLITQTFGYGKSKTSSWALPLNNANFDNEDII